MPVKTISGILTPDQQLQRATLPANSVLSIDMRILFCIPDIDRGGSAKSLSILIERLRSRHELAILTLYPPDPAKKITRRYREFGIPVTFFPWGWLPVDFVGLKVNRDNSRKCSADLRHVIPRLQEESAYFDAICFNSYVSTSLAPALSARTPKLLVAREVMDENSPGFAAARSLLRAHISRAVAIGPVEAEQLERLGIPHDTVFNTGRATPAREPLPDGPPRFCVFSQFARGKGLETLAEAVRIAAPHLRRSGATVRVFGGSASGNPLPLQSRLANFIEENHIGDIISLNGWTDDAESQMKEMHCLLRPDDTGSPWGRDVIEAMSMGRPVLATGSREIFVRPGETGFLVPPKNPEAMAAAIAEAAKSGALAALGSNAYEYARRNFDPDLNAARLENFLFFGQT